LKKAIIDRLENKEKFLNTATINELMVQIQETKMSIENELEDILVIKNACVDVN